MCALPTNSLYACLILNAFRLFFFTWPIIFHCNCNCSHLNALHPLFVLLFCFFESSQSPVTFFARKQKNKTTTIKQFGIYFFVLRCAVPVLVGGHQTVVRDRNGFISQWHRKVEKKITRNAGESWHKTKKCFYYCKNGAHTQSNVLRAPQLVFFSVPFFDHLIHSFIHSLSRQRIHKSTHWYRPPNCRQKAKGSARSRSLG